MTTPTYVIQKRYGMAYRKKPYLVKKRGDKIHIIGQFETRQDAEHLVLLRTIQASKKKDSSMEDMKDVPFYEFFDTEGK